MSLHTVNKKTDCLHRCLALVTDKDAVLLLEDGVYAAVDCAENILLWESVSSELKIYAMKSDLAARGLSDKLLPQVEIVNWPDFVELTCHHDKVISWG